MVPDWNTVLAGAVQSAFIDGAPFGRRTLADGSTIDLGQILTMANCGKAAICSRRRFECRDGAKALGGEQSTMAVVCVR